MRNCRTLSKLLIFFVLLCFGIQSSSDIIAFEISRLEFVPYQNQSNLSLSRDGNSSISGFMIRGETTNRSEGFSTFVGANIQHAIVTLGIANKTTSDETRGEGQVSFLFHTNGKRADYDIVLVNGRLANEGWVDGSHYQQIKSNSTNLVDFPDIIKELGDEFLTLRAITVGVDKFLSLDPLEFRIDLHNSTLSYLGTGVS